MEKLEKFTVYGINHKDLSLEEREKFVIDFKPHKKLKELLNNKLAQDGLLLSTCLRNEFYFWEEEEELSKNFENIKGLSILKGIPALLHLFRITCGFESAIPGEEQILSQIKKAYIEKIEKGERPSPLNNIFNKAIALGKKFRTLSKINENSISVESIGIKESEKFFGNIKDKNIFIVGAGEIASSLTKILIKKGCKDISVIKRKNCLIKDKVNLFDFSDKLSLLYESDIVFSTTSAPHYIFELGELEIEKLINRKRIFIDFAVPRDIDPKIGHIENQVLINLDHLNNISSSSYEKRCLICEEYQWLIDLAIEKTLEWYKRRKI